MVRELQSDGLVERGTLRPSHSRVDRPWRITAKGVAALRDLDPETTVTIAGKTYALPVAVFVIEDMPEVLFGDEIEQKREEWTPRRLEAKR